MTGKGKVKLKLSEIWTLADRELKQVKRTFGDRGDKTACALGAILYYCADPAVRDLNSYELDGYAELQRLSYSAMIEEFQTKALQGLSVEVANDEEGMTFAQLAKKAKELGL